MDFKVFRERESQVVFLLTAIIVPILIDVIFKLALINSNVDAQLQSGLSITRTFLRIISIILGNVFLVRKGFQSKMLQTGAYAFYIYIYVFNIVGLVAGVIFNLLGLSSASNALQASLTTIFADGLAVVLCFAYMPVFRLKLKATLANNWKRYCCFIPLFIAAAIGLNLAFGAIQNLVSSGTSSNEQIFQNNQTWYFLLSVGVLTILVAPIIEELSTRHGIFLLSANPVIGFIASVCFFAEMHVSGNNDLQNIIAYLGGGLAITTTFVVFQYNVYASILVHAGMNTAAFVFLVAR